MTDLATIRIPVDSSDMVRAVQQSKNLERGIKMLVEALDSGAINANQYSAGLSQLQKRFKSLFDNYQQATARVRGHAQSLLESKEAAEQAAVAKNNLAMATKKAETAFALANQKAKAELQTLRNRAEFAWAMAMQRERESQIAVRAAEKQAAAEKRLNVVMQDSQKGFRQSELFVQQLGYQVGDFAVQVQSGTSALVAFAQQGTQILGFLPIAGAFGAVAGAVLAVSTAVLNLGLNMASAKGSIDQAKESLDNFKSGFETLKSSQESVSEAQERYTQAIYLSGIAQANVTPKIIQGLSLEANARQRLLRVEQARFELRKFELEQSIKQQKELVDALFEEVNLLNDPDASSSEFTRTRAESERLERTREIVAANKELFLTLAESQAEIDLINALLSGSGEEFDDILEKAKELGIILPNLDLSNAVSTAALLAKELGISVQLASKLLAMGGGKKEVIFDPRDPNYDPIAAEMARIQGSYGTVSPFDPSRQPKEAGGGRASEVTTLQNKLEEVYKYLELDQYLIEQEKIAFEQRQDVLQSALDKKLITLQEYQELEKAITAQHQQDLANIALAGQQENLTYAADFFGALAGVAAAGGDKMTKAVRVFSAAQALINSYLAYTQVIADPTLPWFAKLPKALGVLAAGMSMVSAIKGGGSSSASGAGRGSATVSAQASAPTPQTVMIDSIDPDSLYSGQTLINLFDAFYNENDKRGKVFVVAR